MVSTAILVARADLPESTIDTALLLPFHIPLEMAPAEGLVLLEAGFRGSQAKGMISVGQERTRSADSNGQLMSADEYAASEEFRNKYISARIRDDWLGNDKLLIKDWLEGSRRFEVNDAVEAQWSELMSTHAAQKEQRDSDVRERQRVIISKEVERFRLNELPRSFTTIDDNLREWSVANSSQPKGKRHILPPRTFSKDSAGKLGKSGGKTSSYKIFLPKGTASAVCVRLNTAPGPILLEILRALATQVVTRTLPEDLSASELADAVHRSVLVMKSVRNNVHPDGTQADLTNEDLQLWADSQWKHVLIR